MVQSQIILVSFKPIWKHICEHISQLSEIYFYQKKRGNSDCGKCCQVSQETEEKLKVYHLSFLLAQKFFLYNISSFLPCRWIQKWCNAILLNCFVMGIFLFGSRQHFQFSIGQKVKKNVFQCTVSLLEFCQAE